MKRIVFVLTALAMLAVSCVKEPKAAVRENDNQNNTNSIVLNITVARQASHPIL